MTNILSITFIISIYFTKVFGNPIQPIHFEFKHQETFALSNADNEDQDYDYEDPSNSDSEGPRARVRRSAKWAPDYDLYSRWAEEYYEEYKAADMNVEPAKKSKGDLLDQLMKRNQTDAELQSEREWQLKKKERIQKAALYGSWALGILIVACVLRVYAKRLFSKCGCDFCDVFRFKRKVQRLVGNFAPGVYIHKNGEKEYYPPTEEELEALREIRKLLYSLH